MAQAATDQLQQLRDIHPPAPPSWWPPAPGWWLLTLILIVLVGLLVLQIRRWRDERAPFKEALLKLDLLQRAYEASELNEVDYVDQADRLIKRVLIHTGHRQEVARLSGQQWLDYLSGALGDPEFSQGAGRIFGDRRFERAPHLGTEKVHEITRKILVKLAKKQ